MDTICIRKYPRAELLERARAHTRRCSLTGHCVESGYGLINEADDRLALLDPAATPLVVDAVRGSGRDAGIRLRVIREKQGEEMRTTRVEET